MIKKYRINIPRTTSQRPKKKEVSAAKLLAQYFQADIDFIPHGTHKAPDFRIKGVRWELKTPTGSGKRVIQRNLERAISQSQNVILDLRSSKLRPDKALNDVRYWSSYMPGLKRLVVIIPGDTAVEVAVKKISKKPLRKYKN